MARRPVPLPFSCGLRVGGASRAARQATQAALPRFALGRSLLYRKTKANSLMRRTTVPLTYA